MARQLPATIITTGYGYRTQLQSQVTVGALASYLSQIEDKIQASTMEVARALPLDMRVHAINMSPGDRLLIARDPLKMIDLPLPLPAGSRVVRVQSPTINLTLPRKQRLSIGWLDKPGNRNPDLDLRRLTGQDSLNQLSPDCMELQLQNGQWQAKRTGQTHIFLDELALGSHSVPLNPSQVVRLMAPGNPYPVLEFQLLLETVTGQENTLLLEQGSTPVIIQTGIEAPTQFLRASGRLTLRQIVAALAQYHALSLSSASIFLAHALPLQTVLHQLEELAGENGFLHVPLESRHARRVLKLDDQYHANTVYSVRSGRTDTGMTIGWRQPGSPGESQLDIDLSASLVASLPEIVPASSIKAQLNYTSYAEVWSLKSAEDSNVRVYINEREVGALPVRLAVGDIITFTTGTGTSLLRLTVDITVE